MTKQSGLGDRLYLNGIDVSGDVGAINEISGGPAVIDTTHVTKDGVERAGTVLSGKLVFDAYHNPTGAHIPLAALPTTDQISTYIRGSVASTPCAGLVAKQGDYPGSKAPDGSLHFVITMLSDIAGVEWGRGYVGGITRTDTTATTGASVDDGAATTAGLIAYLQVISFTGASAVVTIEHSNDDGVSDAYTSVIVFTAVGTAPGAQRMETISTLTVKRWLRVSTSGTFSALKFHVMALRRPLIATGGSVAVDIQVFTASGTWTKPAGVTATLVALIAGGAGGGAGGRSGGGVALSGGAGGGGGGYTFNLFRTSDLAATENVIVGAGGAGDTYIGGIGGSNPGGSSTFGTTSKISALGGSAADSAFAPTATGGSGGNAGEPGSAGANATAGASGGYGILSGSNGAAGGGGGGGVNAANTGFVGGSGGTCVQLNRTGEGAFGALGVAGGDATGSTVNNPAGGQGGGGGGGNTGAANAGKGGKGGIYGGGGGGGGSSATGAGGNGGNGAAGIVVVASW